MSAKAKTTLLISTLLTGGVIAGVHYLQKSEQQAMHAGVIRDEARQKVKMERKAEFEMQKRLEEEYLQIQHVSGKSPEKKEE
ncbi:hypothetical protein BJ508DRAFT_419843 [Ascobolus immersus RN42]|uniref:Cytochrome c oxidase assembly protein n=1 Tax=Ascobolus immersus RN42 TaxID=1160509 RepID=A0A3N4HPN8_ASCIM|nr:hypothetical protein BJ508DRAFT_419843 [Ascobolus immersus RN42]